MSTEACVSTVYSRLRLYTHGQKRYTHKLRKKVNESLILFKTHIHLHIECVCVGMRRMIEAVSQLQKYRKVSTLFRLIYSFIAHRVRKNTHAHTYILKLRCYEVDDAYRECDNITLIRFHEQFLCTLLIFKTLLHFHTRSTTMYTCSTQALLYHKRIENCAWKSMILVIFFFFLSFRSRLIGCFSFILLLFLFKKKKENKPSRWEAWWFEY